MFLHFLLWMHFLLIKRTYKDGHYLRCQERSFVCFAFQDNLERAVKRKFIKEVLVPKNTVLDTDLWKNIHFLKRSIHLVCWKEP